VRYAQASNCTRRANANPRIGYTLCRLRTAIAGRGTQRYPVTSAASSAGATEPADDGGCCSTGGDDRQGLTGLLGALGVLFTLGRRRRRG
jgi:MYXO-CTERM domain-containing protein